MIDSIYIGMTGLLGYSSGLKVIANNTANINTPGFKGSALQFSDLFYSGGNLTSGADTQSFRQVGYGLNTHGASLSFKQGELRQTANALDLAVDGLGLFTLKDSDGNLTYTRAGQFQFNRDGVLVSKSTGAQVMGQSASGGLAPISLAGLQTNSAKATTTVVFTGNLSSTATDQTVGGVTVMDALGSTHNLELKFTNTDATTPGSWSMELLDGSTSVGTGQIIFVDGKPTAATDTASFTYTPSGLAAIPLTLDFSTDVTSFASGNLSTLAAVSNDGYGPGALTQTSFDASGALILTYSNGQTVTGTRLALGRFDSQDAVGTVGDNQFTALDDQAWHSGVATEGAFGSVRSSTIEISNVDLSQEFSDLVIMQRGYQSSSQVITTANDMLQELFAMKSK